MYHVDSLFACTENDIQFAKVFFRLECKIINMNYITCEPFEGLNSSIRRGNDSVEGYGKNTYYIFFGG